MLTAGAILFATLLGASSVLVAAPAYAAQPTTIEFVGTTSLAVDFGDEWSFAATVAMEYDGAIMTTPDPTSGTVTVTVSGIGGTFATELPIQPDGRVYVSQPLDKPLLPAGEYDLTAVFVPAAGTYIATSQTTTPARLTIGSVNATPHVAVVNDAAVSKFPVITATLTGDYVKKHGGPPAGTWAFTATDEGGDEVFSAETAQVEGDNDEIRLEIDSTLEPGTKYTVASTFTVVEEHSTGVTVSDVADETFSTPGETVLDSLATRLAFPWWMVLVVGGLLLALVTTVIILGAKLSKTASRAKPVATEASGIPGDPQNVELMSWDDAGIPEAGTAEVDAEGLPESTTWLLSDIEPEIGQNGALEETTPADAPTERLSTAGSTEDPADDETIAGDTPQKP